MTTEDELVQLIARQVLSRLGEAQRHIPVNISARHVHLSPAHVEALFGQGHQLQHLRDLMQPGQFACRESVAVIGPKGRFPSVRVLGPARGATQVEVSLTDARALGLPVPIRLSGDIAGTPGITLEGPRGRVEIPTGLIVAARHIHLGIADAERLGLAHGQKVAVRTHGARPLIYADVIVRVSERFVPEMHVDTDEGNAGAIRDGDLVEILSEDQVKRR